MTPNFEKSIRDLEKLITAMENPKISLEKLITTYEKALQILKICQKTLDQSKKRIEILEESNQEFLESDSIKK